MWSEWALVNTGIGDTWWAPLYNNRGSRSIPVFTEARWIMTGRSFHSCSFIQLTPQYCRSLDWRKWLYWMGGSIGGGGGDYTLYYLCWNKFFIKFMYVLVYVFKNEILSYWILEEANYNKAVSFNSHPHPYPSLSQWVSPHTPGQHLQLHQVLYNDRKFVLIREIAYFLATSVSQ